MRFGDNGEQIWFFFYTCQIHHGSRSIGDRFAIYKGLQRDKLKSQQNFRVKGTFYKKVFGSKIGDVQNNNVQYRLGLKGN